MMDALSIIINDIISAIESLANLIVQLPSMISYLTSYIDIIIPPFAKTSILLALTISVVLFIIGRK